ncbi:hypothetical protein Tco_1262683 [Tanacetum coccineum]
MAKIAVGERITRSVFGVKGVDLGEEEAPYWTTLGKRESYKPRPSSDGIGTNPPYYARKYFLDCHLPGEWEISRDSKHNPLKDTLVFRRMVFCIWKAFGGNTRDLGSFGEETDKTTDLHQHFSRLCSQRLETASQDTRDAVTIQPMMASEIWRRRQNMDNLKEL